MTKIEVLRQEPENEFNASDTMADSEAAIVVNVLDILAQRRRHESFGTIAKTTELMRRGAGVALQQFTDFKPEPYAKNRNYKNVQI